MGEGCIRRASKTVCMDEVRGVVSSLLRKNPFCTSDCIVDILTLFYPLFLTSLRLHFAHCICICRRELEAYSNSLRYFKSKPTLFLPNSIYLSPTTASKREEETYTCIVTNVQAGEPFQLQLAHDFQRATHASGLQQTPLYTVTKTLAQAARLVHKDNPVIAILSKPAESLALRTKGDVVGVSARLQDIEGIPTVLYVSMKDLSTANIDSNGDLVYHGHKISVVYSRYDFSHPSGIFDTNPPDHAMASPEAWSCEWKAIEKMERSTAIISSNIGCRLAVRRRTHYVLVTQKDALSRFLNEEEASMVRSVLPDQWSLDPLDGKDVVEEARELFEANPNQFVTKNVLRPRTGSGKTQDRTASGGMILKSENEIRELFTNPSRGKHYIMYRKIDARRHHARVVHENLTHDFEDTAISELAVYGAYLRVNGKGDDNDFDTDGHALAGGVNGNVNCLAGVGARTSVISSINNRELAKTLGYGAISAVHVA